MNVGGLYCISLPYLTPGSLALHRPHWKQNRRRKHYAEEQEDWVVKLNRIHVSHFSGQNQNWNQGYNNYWNPGYGNQGYGYGGQQGYGGYGPYGQYDYSSGYYGYGGYGYSKWTGSPLQTPFMCLPTWSQCLTCLCTESAQSSFSHPPDQGNTNYGKSPRRGGHQSSYKPYWSHVVQVCIFFRS